MKTVPVFHLLVFVCIALGVPPGPRDAAMAQSQILEHLDFDDREAPRRFDTRQDGKFRFSEFNNLTHDRRLFTLRTLGTGREPRLANERGNRFMRFEAGDSSVRRDRSEIVIDQNLAENQIYTVAFRLRLPESGGGTFLSDDQWFMITQVKQAGAQSPPSLSINLRRDPEGVFIDLVGRNDADSYRRLASLRLDDPASFTFGEWNDVRLRFRMGPEGFAELHIGNTVRHGSLRQVGASNHRFTYGRQGGQQYVLRMGIYRGGQPRDRFYVDMDNIVFSTP